MRHDPASPLFSLERCSLGTRTAAPLAGDFYLEAVAPKPEAVGCSAHRPPQRETQEAMTMKIKTRIKAGPGEISRKELCRPTPTALK
jgi:hypothetical protein